MRLFVALVVPASWHVIAGDVTDVIAGLGVPLRRVDPTMLHVTLRYLGEVPSAHVAEISAALGGHVSPVHIALTLGRPGTFGPRARTSVAWLRVAGDLEALHSLVHRIELATRLVGLPPARGHFSPHLTLARLSRTTGPEERRAIAETIAALPDPPPLPFIAREVLLMQSVIGRSKPRYEVVGRYS